MIGDDRDDQLRIRRMVTLRDVARDAGVSVTTASRSLNAGAEHRVVTDAYRRRVLEAARRLDYNANVPAREIARGSTSTVAMIVSDIADPYFSSIASGLAAEADRRHLTLLIASTHQDHRREPDLVRRLRAQRPNAIVLTAPRVTDRATELALRRELAAYRRAGGRVALVGRNSLGVPTVEVDDRDGATALAHAMTALGYRDFAALAGPASSTATIDRLDGFRAGLAHEGRVLADAAVIHNTPTRDGGYDGARRLLSSSLRRPRLIFATVDAMAIGALAALRDAGLVPGEHVAVAGFGDVPAARDVVPALTTVRVPDEVVGRRLLAAALDGEEGGIVPTVATEVVVRRSTPGLVPNISIQHLDSQSDRSLL